MTINVIGLCRTTPAAAAISGQETPEPATDTIQHSIDTATQTMTITTEDGENLQHHYTIEKMKSHKLEQELKHLRTDQQMRASDEGL